ncbi:MAG: hypothetical protein A3B30_02135 [Candidatus Komeilibacteria bacterium RIFCSPLOWO2_01_FULL_52_15]|uniref:Uncharacterized protein n=1 Tax=Candidatus Komeilibacteria bacterium RIFCSPLOWO2_01_FULL_52_15 TaxID=1798551 RepID=A0A1G2BT90_9BACT|nr:MAG: hypothetical protein A3B30_02135 [Candidatus Komeilibacteria bacterium RIFCSPLOWO2_01_FULL_52_15]
MQNLVNTLASLAKRITNRLSRATRLEMVGMLAIGALIIVSLFDIDMRVTRKPLLNTFLGSTTGSRISSVGAVSSAAASNPASQASDPAADAALASQVLPEGGVALPVRWGDLGQQLVSTGVIDLQKFEALYSSRGGMTDEMKALLTNTSGEPMKITNENSQYLLNLLWALGLGNKNDVLDKGEMSDPQYGGADRFASTGGWTLARGNPMDHYSKHALVTLTKVQQELVDRVSQGIFRPCCGNSTHFPDCNHGMAMLGLLELMASQGVSEQDMYRAALAVNAFWFPDTYVNIAKFVNQNGQDWRSVNPAQLLGAQFSSSSGYQQIRAQVQPATVPSGGGGCGV